MLRYSLFSISNLVLSPTDYCDIINCMMYKILTYNIKDLGSRTPRLGLSQSMLILESRIGSFQYFLKLTGYWLSKDLSFFSQTRMGSSLLHSLEGSCLVESLAERK